jgi:hypothetical protein
MREVIEDCQELSTVPFVNVRWRHLLTRRCSLLIAASLNAGMGPGNRGVSRHCDLQEEAPAVRRFCIPNSL